MAQKKDMMSKLYRQGIHLTNKGLYIRVGTAFCMCHSKYLSVSPEGEIECILPQHTRDGMYWERVPLPSDAASVMAAACEAIQVAGGVPTFRWPWDREALPAPKFITSLE